MTIKINDTEIELKNSFRAMMVYEAICDKSFTPKGVTEMITYFYSVVVASCPSVDLSFDDFVDYIDEKPELLTEFTEWLSNIKKINEQFNEQKKNQKKRKTTKQ